MVAPTVLDVNDVVIGNATLVEPGCTVAVCEDGTLAKLVLLLERLTTAPVAGAGPVRNTFPCVAYPPTMVGGVIVKELRKTDPPDGATVTAAFADEPA